MCNTPYNSCAARATVTVERLQLLDTDGTPLDLTGYATTDLTYRAGAFGSAPLVTLTIGAGIAVADAANGIITITRDEDDNDQAPGVYRHELVDTSGGAPRIVFPGALTITDSLVWSDV